MEEVKEKILIATYGSLRKGQYNYDRFKNHFGSEFNYLKTSTISGYKLYDLGSYPGLKVSDNEEDVVVIDVLEVSQECFDYIEVMEHGAGYITVKVTDDQSKEKYAAYIYENPCDNLVESGDWSKYLSK